MTIGRLSLLACVLLLGVSDAAAQAFNAVWPLSPAATVTGSATGSVAVSPQVLSPGPAPAIAVFDYQATGQRLWAGNTGWIGGPESPTRFVQFDVTPNIGSSLTVTSVSFEYGASAALNTIESNVWYSTNNWVTRTQLNTAPLLYQRVSLAQFTSTSTIPVSGGAVFSLRIYPYASQNSSSMSQTFAVHNTVRIAGQTALTATCDYLCNTDFEQFAGISGPTTFIQTLDPTIPCWSTTASDSKIEIWNGAGMSVPAYAGSYFAELNASQTATLFQTFQSVAGNQVAISFAHRGRYAAPDVMAVEVGPVGGPYVVLGSYSDNNSGWSHYTVNYTLPMTGTMELRFNSISSNGGAGPAAGGNFLDAIAISCPSGICGLKFNDVNGDGSQGAAEPGLGDWSITLGGAATQTTTTNVNGQFCFLDLSPGEYTVAEVNQAGWTQTSPAAPGTYAVSLGSDQTLQSVNFGNQLQVTGICTDTPQGLVGWWSGDDHANDYSGLANHGSLQGGAGYTVGQVADGFRVGNFADFVSVPDAASLDFGPGQDFTIDLWLKTKQTGLVWIVDKRTSASGSVRGYALYISGGKLGFQMGDGAWQNYLSTGPTINDDRWHFVAVSVDRSSATGITMVVDGAAPEFFDPTGIAGDLGNTSPLLIGRYALGPAQGFGGTIDEVEVFGRSLAQEEIALIRQAGPAGKCKDDRVPIDGSKFEDLDGDGQWDSGEPGMGGVVIEFVQNGVVSTQATTDGSGGFAVTVPPGTYTVREVIPTGYSQTAPASGSYIVTVSNGGRISGLLFGNAPLPIGECIAPPPNLVGWWTGDVDGSDLSGNGNHGTLQGATSVTPGFVAGAFTTAVTGDFITVPDAPSINFGPGQDFSIDAWIRTTDRNGIIQIVDKRDSQLFFGVTGYSLFLHTGRLAFQIAEAPFGHATYASTAPIVADGNWHFVAVTVDRDSKTGLRLFVDNHPVDVFDPTARDGSLVTTMPLYIGGTGLGGFGAAPFPGQIDEVELFNSALADVQIASLFTAGAAGKCKDQVDGSCNDTLNTLPVGTGIDHPANALYAVGGNDAFWTITADPDPTRTVPRPAEVIMSLPTWGAAQAGTVWIGPSQITPDGAFFEQDAIGLGTHTYTLEFCIFGQTATSLTFNLGVMADNAATVWLRKPDGTRTLVGSAPANAFTTPTSITNTLTGSFAAGTYQLEVDVFNDAVPPDFTGMNLSGTITGADLYMQKHECCNSSGKITGTKYGDGNGDGLSAGDTGLAGVVIQLMQGGLVVATTTTDSMGDYFFDVAPGTYTVSEVVPTGYTQTAPIGGSYPVVVGPGGMVANRDFLNHAIPCIAASQEMLCRPNGQRFLRLTITYAGTDPVSDLHVSSLTPGVSFTLATTPTYPILPGSIVVIDVDFAGLGAGASAQLLINMDGPEDEFGVASSCCDGTFTVTRPGGPHSGFEVYCPMVVIGDVLIGLAGDPGTAVSNVGLVIRARSITGRSTMTRTGPEGFFALEGLSELAYDVSVDMPFGYRSADDSQPSFAVLFNDRERTASVHFSIVPGTHTATEGLDGAVPTEYSLDSNYPNPFNPTTTIRYGIPVGGSVRLVVFDMLGRLVASPVDEVQSAGMHEVTFDAGDLSSGMYLYRLESGSYVETRKMVLMK